MPKQKRKPGSRRGVPNRQRETVVAPAANCPRCKCTDLKADGRTRTRDFGHIMRLMIRGQEVIFNRITYHRVVCQACGQHCIRREYHLDPEYAKP